MSFKVMEMKGRAMTKKLKIRFVKFECALAMQVLEMTGKFSDYPIGSNGNIPHTQIGAPCLNDDSVWLCPIPVVKTRLFESNAARDVYLDKVVKWISEEQFATGEKLEIGKKCLFSDDGNDWRSGKYGGKCAEQLGEPRFLSLDGDDWFTRWKYVKPLPLYGAPKIDGDIYTWEERE